MMLRRRPPRHSPEQVAALLELPPCAHCGGLHAIHCPRVKSMEFDGSGALRRVEFWQRWDEGRVVYPEDLPPPPEDDDQE